MANGGQSTNPYINLTNPFVTDGNVTFHSTNPFLQCMFDSDTICNRVESNQTLFSGCDVREAESFIDNKFEQYVVNDAVPKQV